MPKWPKKRFGSDPGDVDLLADAALAGLVVEVEEILVARAHAAGSGHGAHHHGARVVEELLPVRVGFLGVGGCEDAVAVGLGAKSGHGVPGEFGTRSDHQMVVAQLLA
jgi:hypothetical protein